MPEIRNIDIIKELFIYFLIAATIIFLLVVFYTVFYSWKYRNKGVAGEPEQIHENRKFELWMIGISLALVFGFFIYSLKGMNKIQDIPSHPNPDITIIGHQWWWEARYSDGDIVTANEIHVPAGKKILLKLNSADVIHSWWIPKLGRKMDLMPGYDNYLWLFAQDPGEYVGSCSEFCGAQHAWMKIRLIAEKQEDFEEWKTQQLRGSTRVQGEDSLITKGKRLFDTKTCTNCHAVHATEALPNIGPNLAHFASRKYFLSNIKKNNEKNLKAWLTNPQQVKSSANMPNMALTDKEVGQLTHYLQSLK